MRDQAVRLQGYSADEVIVTGVPQFDFYVRKDGLLSREEFCKKHNFDPKKKIILYGSAGAKLFDETRYVRLIRTFIDKGELIDSNILVRPHLGYKGDLERFLELEKDGTIVVDKSDRQNHALRDHFDISIDHIHNLFNSLYHADVCVNVASTLSLDAIACGTEVINFNFDVGPVNYRAGVKRLFISDYVKELMTTGGTYLARSEDEFLDMLKAVLERGEKKNTQKMIDRFIHKIDGMAAERIANALLSICVDTNNKKQ